MAIYYDYAMNHTRPISSTADPATDYIPWLYTKLSDWASKSNGAVQMVTGIPEWQASNNWPFNENSTAYINVKLNGVSYEQGGAAVDQSCNILQLGCGGYSSRPWNFSRIYRPQRIDQSIGFNDISNYSRDASFGYIYADNTFSTSTYGSQNYAFTTNDFSPPTASHVLYSDKPGDQWFYWRFREDESNGLETLIHRITPVDSYPSEFDPGWSIYLDQTSNNVLNMYERQSESSASYERAYSRPTEYNVNNSIGVSSANGAGIYALKRGFAVRDNFGAVVGSRDDFILSTGQQLQSLATYTLGGKNYVCLCRRLLLPYEDFQ